MKKLLYLFAGITLLVSCHTNSITNRKQLALLPESMLQEQALTEYRTFLSQSKGLSENGNKDAEMGRRGGTRSSKAITEYYTAIGLSKELE